MVKKENLYCGQKFYPVKIVVGKVHVGRVCSKQNSCGQSSCGRSSWILNCNMITDLLDINVSVISHKKQTARQEQQHKKFLNILHKKISIYFILFKFRFFYFSCLNIKLLNHGGVHNVLEETEAKLGIFLHYFINRDIMAIAICLRHSLLANSPSLLLPITSTNS